MASATSPDPGLARVIKSLQRSGPEMSSADELADIIWLASRRLFLSATPKENKPVSGPDAGREEPAPRKAQSSPAEEEPPLPTTEGAETPPSAPGQTETEAGAELKVPTAASGVFANGGRPDELLLRVPAARALPAERELMRALRPFRRRVPSRIRFLLDEEETVETIAAQRLSEQSFWSPVMKPDRARWMDIALVIDDAPSMTLWRDTLREFRFLLERLGGFRDVRVWWLDTSSRERISILTRSRSLTPRAPRELAAPDGRRVILVASDCRAPAWEHGVLGTLMAEWGRQQPVAILQMLPQHFWRRTALDPSLGVQYVSVGASEPGAANHALLRRVWRARRGTPPPTGTPIPIFDTDPEMVAGWANLIHRVTAPGIPAVILPSAVKQTVAPSAAAPTSLPDKHGARLVAIERLDAFRRIASTGAFRLAGLLAAAPLRLPVMRLVQRVFEGERARQTELAEFFLSGLIHRASPSPPPGLIEDPDLVDYEFNPGMRDVLLDSGQLSDVLEVQTAVSKYLKTRFGQTLDFPGIVTTPKAVEATQLTEENRVFARVAADVLRRLGSRYAEAVAKLDPANRRQSQPVPSVQTPRLKTVLTEVAALPRALRGVVAARAAWRLYSLLAANPPPPRIDIEDIAFAQDCTERAELTMLTPQPWVESDVAERLKVFSELETRGTGTENLLRLVWGTSIGAAALVSTDDAPRLTAICSDIEKVITTRLAPRGVRGRSDVFAHWTERIMVDLRAVRTLIPQLRLAAKDVLSVRAIEKLGPIHQIARRRFPAEPTAWVLVAGKGSAELGRDLEQIAEWLGYTLAVARFGLVAGGYPGVDEAVTRAFVQRVRQWGAEPSQWLIQVLEPGRPVRVQEGEIRRAETIEESFRQLAARANAAVFLAGGNGTMRVARIANQARLPLFPLRATEGAAEKIYHELAEPRSKDRLDIVPDPNWLSLPPLEALVRLPGKVRQVIISTPKRSGRVSTKSERNLRRSIVKVISTDPKEPMRTGFVLQSPRVIIADGWTNAGQLRTDVVVEDSKGRRHRTDQIGMVRGNPFGPLVLSVPETLSIEGLRPRESNLVFDLDLSIAVTASESDAVVHGKLTSINVDAKIEPIGIVNDVAMMSGNVKPGSTGAPVVDANDRVVGFVIGSSEQHVVLNPIHNWLTPLQQMFTPGSGIPVAESKSRLVTLGMDAINTVVIVLMENRSFDHMLGYRSLSPLSLPLDGQKDDPAWKKQFTNVDVGGEETAPFLNNNPYSLPPKFDPPHQRDNVTAQLGELKNGVYPMNCFVKAIPAKVSADPNVRKLVMGYFGAKEAPMTNFLADNFTICDRWFASLPSGTQPNRLMAMSGVSMIESNATPLPSQDLVYDWLDANNISWCVYHQSIPFFTMMLRWVGRVLLSDHFRPFDQFEADMANTPPSRRPKVVFIEPAYGDSPHLGRSTDDHAPSGISDGQEFLMQVYNAVTASPSFWKSSVTIVAYDEHGGFFDHVSPPMIPTDPPPGANYPQFKSLGIRTPGFIISPFVKPGVCHNLFDHTSILKFIGEKFGPNGLYSPVVDARPVESLSAVLDFSAPINNSPPGPSMDAYVRAVPPPNPLIAEVPPPDNELREGFRNAIDEMKRQGAGADHPKFGTLLSQVP